MFWELSHHKWRYTVAFGALAAASFFGPGSLLSAVLVVLLVVFLVVTAAPFYERVRYLRRARELPMTYEFKTEGGRVWLHVTSKQYGSHSWQAQIIKTENVDKPRLPINLTWAGWKREERSRIFCRHDRGKVHVGVYKARRIYDAEILSPVPPFTVDSSDGDVVFDCEGYESMNPADFISRQMQTQQSIWIRVSDEQGRHKDLPLRIRQVQVKVRQGRTYDHQAWVEVS